MKLDSEKQETKMSDELFKPNMPETVSEDQTFNETRNFANIPKTNTESSAKEKLDTNRKKFNDTSIGSRNILDKFKPVKKQKYLIKSINQTPNLIKSIFNANGKESEANCFSIKDSLTDNFIVFKKQIQNSNFTKNESKMPEKLDKLVKNEEKTVDKKPTFNYK